MQPEAQRIVEPLLEQLDRSLGSSYQALLYGSAARNEFVPGVSDLNLLLLHDRLGPDRLRDLAAALRGSGDRDLPPPLLLEREEWSRAADVFPIEIVDMQAAHVALRGPDPLEGLKVEPGDLRRALEHELRGKLLRLRQAYVLFAADPERLEEVVGSSVGSVAALFRALLALAGREVPRDTPAAIRSAGPVIGADSDPVRVLWEERRRKVTRCPPERFEGYLAAIAAAVGWVDKFTGGAK